MIKRSEFTEMALSFQGAEQAPHFERTGFRIKGRRMFATYLDKNNSANIFLNTEEQAFFCNSDPVHIYQVPNKWGKKGATTFELDALPKEWVQEALLSAYKHSLR